MIFPFSDNVPLHRTPLVTYALIAMNCVTFLLALRLGDAERQLLIVERGFIPARVRQFYDPRPVVVPIEIVAQQRHLPNQVLRVPAVIEADPLSVFTSCFSAMFLHGSPLHLLSNMWFLWLFGDNVEDRLGRVSYGCFYLLGGVLAMFCHWLADPSSVVPVIGASGAIAAVLGAFAVTWPWARIRCLVFLIIFFTVIELPALVVLGIWFVTQMIEARESLALGLNGGVAWWAHVGGFVAGAVIMPLISDGPEDHELEHEVVV
jgi:membrane associated rhomboid family serine protease